jgi:signal peptidase II
VVLVVVAALVVAVDQMTKWWAVNTLDDRTIDLIWTLRLRLVFNTGAAFSRFDGLGPLLGVAAVVIVGVLLWMGRVSPDRRTAAALGAIAGGALGNLLDRLFREGEGLLGGAVVDFIDIQWWPVWNVADMAIVLGSAALVVVAGRTR